MRIPHHSSLFEYLPVEMAGFSEKLWKTATSAHLIAMLA